MPDEPRRVRTAFADDEPLARATLRKLLAADPQIEVVAECRNGREAVSAVRKLSPDLLLLDVQMPGLNGFGVLEELDEEEIPMVIFATAYDRYAMRAFDVHAVDYVLKPFDDERFQQALERAKERLRTREVVGMGQKLAELLRMVGSEGGNAAERGTEPHAQRLSIHREGSVEVIDVDRIVWIEASDQYVVIHTEDSEHLLRESMSGLEQRLDPSRFLRIHRSAIVALERVRRLEKTPSGVGRVLIGADTWLPVSRTRMAQVRDRLG
jgi:two-component system LytT family response regulator